jgi:hypothetical protein
LVGGRDPFRKANTTSDKYTADAFLSSATNEFRNNYKKVERAARRKGVLTPTSALKILVGRMMENNPGERMELWKAIRFFKKLLQKR